MLPPYIIEELRRREEARQEERARPRPQLDRPMPPAPKRPSEAPSDRGIVIIDVM